jgi:excisionase family DNA binding protein
MITERDLLTPEQVAEYLQVKRETVYRYIREGKLVAARLGRTYRVPKANVDLLVYAASGPIRSYSKPEVAEFMRLDTMTPEQNAVADRMLPETRARNG